MRKIIDLQMKIWKTDIESDKLTATLKRLNTISKENVDEMENLIKKLQILDEIWEILVDEPKEIIKALIPVFQRLVDEDYPDIKFDSLEIEDFLEEKIKEIYLIL